MIEDGCLDKEFLIVIEYFEFVKFVVGISDKENEFNFKFFVLDFWSGF